MNQWIATEQLLSGLQADAYACVTALIDPTTGLARDSSRPDAPLSIAASGMALLTLAVGARCGLTTRDFAAQHARTALSFLLHAPQGTHADATGHRGFFYHFLIPTTGRRFNDCELSTIDSGILIAAALIIAVYFDGEDPVEREIRSLADDLYRRIDWTWATAGQHAICHGWKPESGFLASYWEGYSEGLFLYMLALGSPTYALSAASYAAYTKKYRWLTVYGIEYLYAAPLFIHQMSHCFLDLEGIRDESMRSKGCDYFENSRRATQVQQRYAMANPLGFRGYGEFSWGITACEGPGQPQRQIDGIERTFFGYQMRGVPHGPDDGTLAPWAAATSLPFAPEIVIPTLNQCMQQGLHGSSGRGCLWTHNATCIAPDGSPWTSHQYYPLNQGPVVIMIENHSRRTIWNWMRQVPCLVKGLRAAGFTGGWLAKS